MVAEDVEREAVQEDWRTKHWRVGISILRKYTPVKKADMMVLLVGLSTRSSRLHSEQLRVTPVLLQLIQFLVYI